jgi:type II secretory pathway pseudopilin PulG
MDTDPALLVSSLALIAALGALILAVLQLQKAGEQLGAARDSNTLADQALREDLKRRNIDALIGLLEALRNLELAAAHQAVGGRSNSLAGEHGRALLAIARAAPCLPTDGEGELREVLEQGPELFTGHPARDAYTKVLRSLGELTGLDWLKQPAPDPAVILAYLQAPPGTPAPPS